MDDRALTMVLVKFLGLLLVWATYWAYSEHKKQSLIPKIKIFISNIPQMLKFCFIKLPKFLLIASLITAVVITPFYFFGIVNGVIILACAVVIISKLKTWNTGDIQGLLTLSQSHVETLNKLRATQDKGMQTLLGKTEELERQFGELYLEIDDIKERQNVNAELVLHIYDKQKGVTK